MLDSSYDEFAHSGVNVQDALVRPRCDPTLLRAEVGLVSTFMPAIRMEYPFRLPTPSSMYVDEHRARA